MAKKKAPTTIDPTSAEPVIAYVGDPDRHHGIVPSRDLSGHDLARIGFRRRYQVSEDDLKTRGTVLALDAGHGDVDKIAEELVATGNWSYDVPRETLASEAPATEPTPTDPPTPEPATPADPTEAQS